MIDFSGETYQAIAGRMLERVTEAIDKREGSMIQTAVGPMAYALEEVYLELALLQSGAFVQTAGAEDLDLLAAEQGLSRYPASKAVRLGVFNIDVPLQSRFSTNEPEPVNYTVTERISAGRFRLTCETAGSIGNRYTGPLLAITYIQGLTSAELSDILVPGDDEETDGTLRARYIEHVNSRPFGGNVASYREAVLAIEGVGGVQIYPTWNGGGTVKCSVIGSDLMPAPPELLETVQTALDPTANAGAGYGLAPIGAAVTVVAPSTFAVAVAATVSVASGYTLPQLEPEIEAAVEAYFEELRGRWATPTVAGTTTYALAVYRARVSAAVLSVTGVTNVTGLTLNGADADIELVESGTEQQLPVLGTVTLSGD